MQHQRHLLVATDIFGATSALQQALSVLQSAVDGIELSICQPSSSAAAASVFTDDQLAYQAFLQHGGLERYQQQVQHAIQLQQPDFVLGFSAGAAALWCALGHGSAAVKPGRALLCYGGQIRQYSDLVPLWPVVCLWSDEQHFDVRALERALQQHPHLQQQHWTQQHGFINPHSKGYQAEAAAEFWRRCQYWIVEKDF